MAAFGTGCFDNEEALDWAYELESADGAEFLEETLRAVMDVSDDLLEPPIVARGLAAAEVIAALRGAPGDELPHEVETWVESNRKRKRAKALAPLAAQAVTRIRAHGEAVELWTDSETKEVWNETLVSLIERLESE